MNRRKLIGLCIIVPILLIAIGADILVESDVSMYYASAPIRLGNQTIYVKARDCGAICSGWLWISQNPDRCVREDARRDYVGSYGDTVTYAVANKAFILVDDSRAWQNPTSGDWLHLQFIPEYGHAEDAYSIQHVYFGGGVLPDRAAPGVAVELRPCIRFIGHTWN